MNKRLVALLVLLSVVVIGAGIYLYSSGWLGTGSPPQVSKAPPEADQQKKPAKGPEAGGKVPDESAVQSKGRSAFLKYAAQDRRDPFVPLVLRQETEKRRGVTPLEDYEISEFKLVAILSSKSGYYAVITMPDGKSYTVKEGMRIGLHGGKVQKIHKDSVVVRETVRNERGVLGQRDTVLKLRLEDQA
jgi:Tfp pilus assembly protein PilP